ncbi:integrin alpha-IIb [Pelodytes ibericus]
MELCLILLLLPIIVQALNLDDQNPHIFSGPKGSYFGFSLDFYHAADGGMNIVVGAPQLNTSQPRIMNGGGVFMCPWNSKTRNCTLMSFGQTGDTTINSSDATMQVFKTNQWFGATVRTWKTSIVACAPMQHWNFLRNGRDSGNTPTGACYLTNNLQIFHEFAPCRDTKTNKRYCELGFSAEIHKDGTLLTGAPGGYFFHGLYATVNLNNIPFFKQTQSLLRTDIGHRIPYDFGTDIDLYKGFSVAFGEFAGDNQPELVIGAPTYKYMGIVEIFSSRNLLQRLYAFYGDQIAAYFGHTVTVTDVNNDGKDDVLVGAPLYMERRTGGVLQEVGRVYVYLQRWTDRLYFEEKILSGNRVYEQFGASIAPLGDMDLDGFPDIAVSSPFGGRSGGGCVYIYKGEVSGLSSQPSQVLESPLSPPSRFGFSLRGGTDIDANGYPDLLVGAFETEKVYLYRARPVTLLSTELLFHPDALNPDLKLCSMNNSQFFVSCFTVSVCAKITGKSLPKTLMLSTELQLDRQKNKFSRRTHFLDSLQSNKNISMILESNSKPFCSNITAFLRPESEFKDKLSPIVVSVNFSLAGQHSADTVQPILHGSTFLQNQTHILLDCGEDNVCIPDLHLNVTWPNEPLLVGIDNLVHVQFHAFNFGEGAYETELYVRLPAGAHYIQVLQESEEKIICSPKKENETELLICELGNPMKNKMEIHAGLQLSFSNLENYGSNVTFSMQIKSRNSKNSSSPNVWVLLDVVVEASLELRGSSHPAEVVLPLPNWEPKEESKKPLDYGVKVTHVYELHNAGPGTVHVQLVLQSPESYQGDFFLYPLILDIDSQITCNNQSQLNPLELDLTVATETPVNKTISGDHRLNKRETGSLDMEVKREDEEESDTSTEEENKQKHPILLNCSSLPCWEIQCSVQNLERGQRATLKLISILWVSSFMKRIQRPVTLLSQGSFQVTGAPYRIQPMTMLANETSTDTRVLWVSPDGQKEIPLWWIIVGVLGGLLILALFIFIMWKLGFFQRTRPPMDDQEELTN